MPEKLKTPLLQHYAALFDEVIQASSSEPPGLKVFREQGYEAFKTLGFPSRKEEAWRHANIAWVHEKKFEKAKATVPEITEEFLAKHLFEEKSWPRFVFINGFFCKALSQFREIENEIQIYPISCLSKQNENFLDRLGKIALSKVNALPAFNAAFFQDGIVLSLKKGTVVHEPIHVLQFFTGSGKRPVMSQTRNLFVLEPNSRASIIESHMGLSENEHLNNHVTEIRVEERAHLNYYKWIQGNKHTLHVSSTEAHVLRGGVLNARHFILNGQWSRSDFVARLEDEGASISAEGLYFSRAQEHVDQYLLIHHLKSQGTSRQFYKGIIDDRSTAVFNGKVYVYPDAQKTNAEQVNKNLLLAQTAHVVSRPQLEIYADDVKCSHGSATGQLDEQALFYMKTRGIGEREAKRLLCFGFANEVIQKVELKPMARALEFFAANRFGATD